MNLFVFTYIHACDDDDAAASSTRFAGIPVNMTGFAQKLRSAGYATHMTGGRESHFCFLFSVFVFCFCSVFPVAGDEAALLLVRFY